VAQGTETTTVARAVAQEADPKLAQLNQGVTQIVPDSVAVAADRKAFDFAADVTKPVLTLSTAILALNITFAKDIVAAQTGWPLWLLGLGWGAYILSMFCGLGTLMALTRALGRPADERGRGIYTLRIRLYSISQIVTFALGTVSVFTFSIINLIRKASPGWPFSSLLIS
jgi:hypothetical protein